MLNEHKAKHPKRERERETALKTNESSENVTDKTHVTDKTYVTDKTHITNKCLAECHQPDPPS